MDGQSRGTRSSVIDSRKAKFSQGAAAVENSYLT